MKDRKYIIVVAILLSLMIKMVKGKIETGQGYGMGIGRCNRLSPVANEA